MRTRTHIAHMVGATDKQIKARKNVLRERFKRLVDNADMPGNQKGFLKDNLWSIVKELEDMAFFKADRNYSNRIKELEWILTNSSTKTLTSKPLPKRTMKLKKLIQKKPQRLTMMVTAMVAKFKGIIYVPQV